MPVDQNQPPVAAGYPLPNLRPMTEEARNKSIELARKFYQADSQLLVQDRKKLAGCFWTQTVFFPFLGIPIIYGAIMAPNWLKKAGKIDPKKSYRGVQVVLGFFGVVMGQVVAYRVGYYVNYYRLGNDENRKTCWSILGKLSPHIGGKYYMVTQKKPELAMKDPDTIDWKTQPVFPLNIVFNREFMLATGSNRSPVYQMEPRPGWPGSKPDEQQRADDSQDEFNSTWGQTSEENVETPKQSSRPGSSWDRLRQSNQNTSPEKPSISHGAPISQEKFDNMIDNASGGNYDRDIEKEQERFDNMIEQTKPTRYNVSLDKAQAQFDELVDRSRSGEEIVDDFSESEKKWT